MSRPTESEPHPENTPIETALTDLNNVSGRELIMASYEDMDVGDARLATLLFIAQQYTIQKIRQNSTPENFDDSAKLKLQELQVVFAGIASGNWQHARNFLTTKQVMSRSPRDQAAIRDIRIGLNA